MKRRAFTLIEMLIVIAIAAILMGMVAGSLATARYLARRTKAEAQLREMITAWHEYFILYGSWPSDVDTGGEVEMTYDKLDALIDSENEDENPRKLVFLNVTLKSENPNEPYCDPWGTVYKLKFSTTGGNVADVTALRLSVNLPNRKRRMMY